jgi:hypothetical protein
MPLYNAAPAAGRWLTPHHGGIATTSQTFTAGRVLLVQFTVPVPCMIDGLAYGVGGVSSGNVIGGIVGPATQASDTALAAVVLAQSASTAQGSANGAQVLTWTAVAVAPGIYDAALESNDATATYTRHGAATQAPGLAYFYDRSGGYGALTDPTPAVSATSSIVPGIRVRVA